MLNVNYMVKLEDSYLIIDDRTLIERLIELGAGIEEGGKAKIPLLEAAYFAEKKIIDFDMTYTIFAPVIKKQTAICKLNL